jgi:hypothetical protein
LRSWEAENGGNGWVGSAEGGEGEKPGASGHLAEGPATVEKTVSAMKHGSEKTKKAAGGDSKRQG